MRKYMLYRCHVIFNSVCTQNQILAEGTHSRIQFVVCSYMHNRQHGTNKMQTVVISNEAQHLHTHTHTRLRLSRIYALAEMR